MKSMRVNSEAIDSSAQKSSYSLTEAEKRISTVWPVPHGEEAAGDDFGSKISRESLVNRLNFINFQDDRIQVHFRHPQNNHNLMIPAFPEPCFGKVLTCRWEKTTELSFLLRTYDLAYILVPRGENFIQSIPEAVTIDADGCRLRLPKVNREISRRRVERQRCHGIGVHLVQNENAFSGTLLDFSATSFRVELSHEGSRGFDGLDAEQPATVLFHAGGQTYFSGECRILRMAQEQQTRSYVLEPLRDEAQCYQKAEFRSQRQTLRPSPNLILRHPLTQKHLDLKVVDLSGSGFSVEEEERSASLLPGLILPKVELNFAGIFKMNCTAQVVFRRPSSEKNDCIRCGLALIDAAAKDHVKLLGILHQAKDKNSYICNDLDLEALWDFLFDTGFIYPKKYALIEKKKEEIKKTYAKLYKKSPEIARHFVYQRNGRILGHMATIRYWKNAWLIHHHAARKSSMKKAGLIVLDQIGRFGHDTFRIGRMHMDYLVCYYRPQNRFPHRVFGGVAGHVNDPKGCSLDLFAFMKHSDAGEAAPALSSEWTLSPAEVSDMGMLAQYYEKESGGLMLKALDLEPSNWREEELSTEFHNYGFKRERRLFALRKNGSTKAILLINISDVGLNLSDLTCCINAFILDPEYLPRGVFLSALRCAERISGRSTLPALVFPMSYVEENSISFEKAYNLWVFHLQSQSQAYFRYLHRLLNRT